MKTTAQQDRTRLLAMARSIADKLLIKSEGTSVRIHRPNKVHRPATDGWRTGIGHLGKHQPRMQIWLDRFSGYPERRFNACLYTYNRSAIINITKRVKKTLWPIRIITKKETNTGKFFTLNKRLQRSEFNAPILEEYGTRETLFGIYDGSRKTHARRQSEFCERAVAFFDDVARSMPGAKEEDIQRGVYSSCENRKWVKTHLRRERSGYLAVQCKARDDYRCQVCSMSFAKTYGKVLGLAFAEAHHIRPLGQQGDKVKTKLEDLVTVCANCHRMLHRMVGKPKDIEKLRSIVKEQRRRRK